jgi:hypothetical protein
VAKPDKTDLRNASIALSMNAWAKATIDLNWLRERERLPLHPDREMINIKRNSTTDP